jgi:hypothetical protein
VYLFNHYPTSIFGGTKSLVLTEDQVIGDRSLYLGVVQIVVSCLVLFYTIFLLVVQFVWRPDRASAIRIEDETLQSSTKD